MNTERVRSKTELLDQFELRRNEIRERLAEFAAVPVEHWFYEVCFCLLTPQTKAIHAQAAIEELRNLRFLEVGLDPVNVLRNPDGYIRFHNVKAARLLALRQHWPNLLDVLLKARQTGTTDGIANRSLRDLVKALVHGMGFKEASHVLRNLGWRGLAILDRHILTYLVKYGVFTDIPLVGTERSYKYVEQRFLEFSTEVGVDIDELDLLFWSLNTGIVFK